MTDSGDVTKGLHFWEADYCVPFPKLIPNHVIFRPWAINLNYAQLVLVLAIFQINILTVCC
jgi:hypothetical protein